jgi:hypothetical protein
MNGVHDPAGRSGLGLLGHGRTPMAGWMPRLMRPSVRCSALLSRRLSGPPPPPPSTRRVRPVIELGLGRMRHILNSLGSPDRELRGRVVHVGGTNGKGSVCACVASALRAAGHRVGLFTSPHLVSETGLQTLPSRTRSETAGGHCCGGYYSTAAAAAAAAALLLQ